MTDARHPEHSELHIPGDLVYVRELRPDELPEEARGMAAAHGKLYGIHDPNGERLAMTDNRALAFSLARQHDRRPVSVH